jgi:hypothetical protein
MRYPPLHCVRALHSPQRPRICKTTRAKQLYIALSISSEEVQLELIRVAQETIQITVEYGDTPRHIGARNGVTMSVM